MSTKNKKPSKKSLFSLHHQLISPSYTGTTVRALLLLVLFASLVLVPIFPLITLNSTSPAAVQALLLLSLFLIVVVVYDALYVTMVQAHRVYPFDRWFLIIAEMTCLGWLVGYSLFDTANSVAMNMTGMWLFTLAIVLPLLRLMVVLLPGSQKIK